MPGVKSSYCVTVLVKLSPSRDELPRPITPKGGLSASAMRSPGNAATGAVRIVASERLSRHSRPTGPNPLGSPNCGADSPIGVSPRTGDPRDYENY